jgi:hypothetical protein
MFKKCFTCNRKYPLFLFYVNKLKYQLPSDKGRCVNCRFCEIKYLFKRNGYVVRYDFITNKMVMININLTFKNILKEFIKK